MRTSQADRRQRRSTSTAERVHGDGAGVLRGARPRRRTRNCLRGGQAGRAGGQRPVGRGRRARPRPDVGCRPVAGQPAGRRTSRSAGPGARAETPTSWAHLDDRAGRRDGAGRAAVRASSLVAGARGGVLAGAATSTRSAAAVLSAADDRATGSTASAAACSTPGSYGWAGPTPAGSRRRTPPSCSGDVAARRRAPGSGSAVPTTRRWPSSTARTRRHCARRVTRFDALGADGHALRVPRLRLRAACRRSRPAPGAPPGRTRAA